MKRQTELINRPYYIEELARARRKDAVKIITGVRHSGKTSLLRLLYFYLREHHVAANRIIEVPLGIDTVSGEALNDIIAHIKQKLPDDTHSAGSKVFVLIDEIQRLNNWPEILKSLKENFHCDIYATLSGSTENAKKQFPWLKENCVELHVFPLSLREFAAFHEFQFYNSALSAGYDKKYIIYNKEGFKYREDDFVKAYLSFGGMPQLRQIGFDKAHNRSFYDAMQSSIFMHDILEKDFLSNSRRLTDPLLLRQVSSYLAENIGENLSDTFITRSLNDKHKSSHAIQTVQAYIKALTDAFLFYPVSRYDIKKEEMLSTLSRRYIVDTGIGNMLSMQEEDRQRRNLENAAYFELLRRGYKVTNGMLRGKKIDFVAEKGREKKYFQIVATSKNQHELARALSALRATRDSYEKTVITNDLCSTMTRDGIKIIKALDFFLNE